MIFQKRQEAEQKKEEKQTLTSKNIKDVEAIIFDNDGTIADTRKIIVNSMEYAFEKVLGESADNYEYLRWLGMPLEDQMPKFTNDIEKQKEMVKVYRENDALHHDELIEKFADCKGALTTLKNRGFNLAVATSKMKERCIQGLEILEIKDLMSEVVGCEQTELHKPKPDPILYCAEQLGIDIEKCAYVGDAPFDIQAANSAGCVSIGVTWGFFTRVKLQEFEPSFIVDSFDELTELFQK